MPKTKQCPHCTETFSKSKSRKNHMNITGHGWICSDSSCVDVRSADLSQLEQHCRTFHPGGPVEAVRQRPVQVAEAASTSAGGTVTQAPSVFASVKQEPALGPSQNPSNTTSGHCVICGEWASNVMEHISTDHKSCFVCGVSCVHIQTHFKYSHPSYYCDECRMPFISERKVKTHTCRVSQALPSLEAVKVIHSSPKIVASSCPISPDVTTADLKPGQAENIPHATET
ncbi:hypothetical protein BDY19DRAFT_153459 [Irpex rosettiformis]|uniref:Uncharacterized protein n=1 Tax=Irpex rosettiformis TaxID=378272 RepID=A0ACB8U3B4_9APHY|nr:hypothetical protein BDY19DRAFT_153459 [Irpex rosettiformis]